MRDLLDIDEVMERIAIPLYSMTNVSQLTNPKLTKFYKRDFLFASKSIEWSCLNSCYVLRNQQVLALVGNLFTNRHFNIAINVWIKIGALIGVFIFHFIPYYDASVRNHPNRYPIIAINLFLGWSIVGWVGACLGINY